MNKPESETLEEYQTRADETDDGFHNGQLRVLQPRKGYRAGLDAVMIAAAVPALPGERIVEAGSGTGVASLCLINRVAGLTLFGLEVNRQYADLSRRNADRNKLRGGFHVVEGDIAMPPRQYGEYGLEPGSFAHAFANPPYRDEAGARAGADEGRNRANLLSSGELLSWVKFLVAMARPKGTISLVLPVAMLDETLSLLKGRAGNAVIFPLFPRQNEPAKRVIVQATRGTRAPLTLLAGLVLHNADGSYTGKADAILRGEERLSLDARR